jgi:prevent-host-death family protein
VVRRCGDISSSIRRCNRDFVLVVEAMKMVTMREFSQDAAGVVREMNEDQEPFVLTRHGRMVAIVTPVPDGLVEKAVASKWLKQQALRCVEIDQGLRA